MNGQGFRFGIDAVKLGGVIFMGSKCLVTFRPHEEETLLCLSMSRSDCPVTRRHTPEEHKSQRISYYITRNCDFL